MNCFENNGTLFWAMEIVLCVPEWTLCLNCLEKNCFAYKADDLRKVILEWELDKFQGIEYCVSVGRETSFPHIRCSVSSE